MGKNLSPPPPPPPPPPDWLYPALKIANYNNSTCNKKLHIHFVCVHDVSEVTRLSSLEEYFSAVEYKQMHAQLDKSLTNLLRFRLFC